MRARIVLFRILSNEAYLYALESQELLVSEVVPKEMVPDLVRIILNEIAILKELGEVAS